MAQSNGDPNVLFINCHDLGQHLGCYGQQLHTPNIDALASGGARFENSYCVAPQCSPSRAAMFTGRYPHQNGVMGLTHGEFEWDLHPTESHFAGILSDAGWNTVSVGVQHATRRPESFFDATMPASLDSKEIANTTCKALKQQAERSDSFYLQVGFYDPHRRPDRDTGFEGTPTSASESTALPNYLVDEQRAREEFAAFEHAIEIVDNSVGRILTQLEKLQLESNTIVVFTTDHGIPFPRAKCSPYDPGIETAFIVQWLDGSIPSKREFTQTISNVDYLPSLLDLLEVPIPDSLEGESFASVFTDPEYDHRESVFGELTYHDYFDPRRWVRTEKYKLVANFSKAPFFMDPSQTWRPNTITVSPEDPRLAYHPPIECYDLETDGEMQNIASDVDTDVLNQLCSELWNWMVRTDDPLIDGFPVPPLYDKTTAILSGESTSHSMDDHEL